MLKWLQEPHVNLTRAYARGITSTYGRVQAYACPYGCTPSPSLRSGFCGRYIKIWWDSDVKWTSELVTAKYGSYVHGHKDDKRMYAFVIRADATPIGYIQIYNAYDFLHGVHLYKLPKKLGALDIFIGELNYLKRGFGTQSLLAFLDNFQFFEHVLVSPHHNNHAAIHTYEKAGFSHIKNVGDEVWMLRSCF
jgi:aminoglycoside 6'-N-acetyltransferase